MLVKRPDVSWKFLESLKAAVRQVLREIDEAHLLDRLFLLDALPQLDNVRVQPVVLGGQLEMNVAEESLVVSQSDTLERLDPGATHLSEDPPDEVDGAEHLLHSDSLGGTHAVDHTLNLLTGSVDDSGCQGLLFEDHHHVPAHREEVAGSSVWGIQLQ